MSNKISLKEINKIALPSILAGIAEPLISLSDIAIVGNIPNNSTEVLAAVGIAGSFLSALIWVLAQTKTAISSLTSQNLGAGKVENTKTLISQTIFMNLILSLIVYYVTSIFAVEIFKYYNADGLVLNYAVSYFKIRAFGFPFTLITFSIFGALQGLQNTKYAMYISIIGGLVNISLDLLLVFGYKSIPAMGIEGAAYASLVAQFLMMIMSIWVLTTKTQFSLKIGKQIHPELGTLLKMSLNLFLRTVALNYAIYLANKYATGYGAEYIAAQTIAMNIWLFSSFFIDGYANAGNAISGKLLGAKDYKKLWKLGVDLSKYAILISIILGGVYAIGYTFIGKLFTSNTEVLNVFYSVFWMVIIMQPINAIAFTFDGIFKGLGEAKYLRNLLLTATFIGFAPTIFIADFYELKLHGIWIAFTVWMIIRSLGLIVKFRIKYMN
ncbi:MAG: MATE family efflux transporter [Ichthyobacteriaceae bacterium]|nr:MATE family efflux transporter [Ichthyobacteriaceae bacterium]